MAFLGFVPSEHSSGAKERRGGTTKTGNTHARRLLAGQPPEVVVLVRKAHLRLHKRYARLVGRGKRPPLAVTAVARGLCGFVWALMAHEAA